MAKHKSSRRQRGERKKLSRKQRAEQRAKLFARNQKPPPPASPQATPFLKDRRRFEYAVWFFLIGLKLFSKLEAARIAAAFFDRRSLINAIDEVRNGKTYIGISATYQGGLDSSVNALEDKAKYLLKHSDDVILRLDKAGSRWLTESASVLTMLFKAATEGNTKDAAAMVELLIGQGWDRGLIRQAFRGLIRQAFLRTPTNPMKLLPK